MRPRRGPFDFVSLLIGVNNQYRGRPLDEYRVQFQALLQRAIGLPVAVPGACWCCPSRLGRNPVRYRQRP